MSARDRSRPWFRRAGRVDEVLAVALAHEAERRAALAPVEPLDENGCEELLARSRGKVVDLYFGKLSLVSNSIHRFLMLPLFALACFGCGEEFMFSSASELDAAADADSRGDASRGGDVGPAWGTDGADAGSGDAAIEDGGRGEDGAPPEAAPLPLCCNVGADPGGAYDGGIVPCGGWECVEDGGSKDTCHGLPRPCAVGWRCEWIDPQTGYLYTDGSVIECQ